jgi:hypothetical protein
MMKAVITALCLIASFAVVGFGQSQVTVTGEVMNATRGYVGFRLIPWSSSVHYFVPGITTITTQEVRCGINATGQVQNSALNGPCLVWGNDVISPANTTYTVVFAPNNQISNTVARESLTGSAYNLNNPVFAPIVNLVPQVTSITSPPLNANLVPAADAAFTLGAPGRKYANGFFDNLTVDNFTLSSQNIQNLNTDTLNAGNLNVANNMNIGGAMTLNGASGNPGQVIRNQVTGGTNRILEFGTPPARVTSDYNFSQTPQVNLTAGVAATITLNPCWVGFDGTSGHYYIYVSGGVGAAEAVLVTGGTCTSGANTGTVTFTPLNNHTGAWTLTSATAGCREAVNAVASGGEVIFPAGVSNVYQSCYIDRPVLVRGQGETASDIEVNTSGTSAGLNYYIFDVNTNLSVTFTDLSVQSHTAAQSADGGAIRLSSPVANSANERARITHVTTFQLYNTIYAGTAATWTIDSCTFIQSTNYGVFVDNTVNADEGDSGITNTFILNLASAGIGTAGSVPGNAGVYIQGSGGFRFIGNKVNGFNVGFHLNARTNLTGQIKIIGSGFDGFASTGVLLETPTGTAWSSITVSSNYFASWLNNGIGVLLNGATLFDGVITDNIFQRYGNLTGLVGIQVNAASMWHIHGNIFNLENVGIQINADNTVAYNTVIGQNVYNMVNSHIINNGNPTTDMRLSGEPNDMLGFRSVGQEADAPSLVAVGSGNSGTAAIIQDSPRIGGATLSLATNGGTSPTDHTQAPAGGVGQIQFYAADGGGYSAVGTMQAIADVPATPGNSPGSLLWWTTPTGSATPVRNMALGSTGGLVVGPTAGPGASGTVNAQTGYLVNSTPGYSGTLNVRNAANTAACTITVTGGIITASTCQ